jgi:CheY-like chemotaxis protein
VISGVDTTRDGFALGAITCSGKAGGRQLLEQIFPKVQKSIQKQQQTLLVMSRSEPMREEIRSFLSIPDCGFLEAAGEEEAIHLLSEKPVDGIILDWAVTELGGIEFIENLQTRFEGLVPPVVILGSSRIDGARIADLHRLAKRSYLRYAPSLERMLHEVTHFLHRSEESLSGRHKEILTRIRETDTALAGRKVLVVDDDLRNIFALTSVLEQAEMKVLHAENGTSGIEVLQQNPDVDLVLMDIMMPEMDGYETTRAIRQLPRFRSTPIVALTAKAMKGDREKCLLAGASDYVTKPVDLNYLFSVMRVWLARLGEPMESMTAGKSTGRVV